jgi:hypothetical protein
MTKDMQSPIFSAFTVIQREGEKDFWLNIGSAFPHSDGKGFNVVLQAMPIDGKIVVRPRKGQQDERPAKNDTHGA